MASAARVLVVPTSSRPARPWRITPSAGSRASISASRLNNSRHAGKRAASPFGTHGAGAAEPPRQHGPTSIAGQFVTPGPLLEEGRLRRDHADYRHTIRQLMAQAIVLDNATDWTNFIKRDWAATSAVGEAAAKKSVSLVREARHHGRR